MNTQPNLISRQEALDRLSLLRAQLIARKNRAGASVVLECLDIIQSCEAAKPVAIPAEASTAETVKKVEPWWPGAQTGREVICCGACETIVTARDRFCKFCGRKLVKPDDGNRRTP